MHLLGYLYEDIEVVCQGSKLTSMNVILFTKLNCGYLLGCTCIFYVRLLATGKLERAEYTPAFLIAICTRIFTCAVAMLAFIYLLTFHADIRAGHKQPRTVISKCAVCILIS
jgi:hypothetical protein